MKRNEYEMDERNKKAVSPSLVCEDVKSEIELILEEEDEASEGSISSESEGSGADCVSRTKLIKAEKDIWTPDEIVTELKRVSGGKEAAGLARTGRTEILSKIPGGVLWASWLGRPLTLQRLLTTGASPHTKDGVGRTGMHLAALVGSAECLTILIKKGAKVNQWDNEFKAMPLHCASSAKSLQCVKLLLDNGADANAGLTQRSPLHYAVQSNSPDCVMELLKRGACPDTTQVYTETPLHVAAARGFMECLLLLLKHGADVRAQLGVVRATALHLAAEEGHTECAKILIEAGAPMEARNVKMQTPLHLASIAQAADSLELLIQKGASTKAKDIDGRTPLHGALGRASRCGDCIRLLLAARANVNQPDHFGYTPVHLAALNEFSSCVCLLLDHGGDVTLRTKGGHSVLSFIVRRTPEVIPKLIAKFDEAIRVTDHEIGDVDCELKLDFRPLVPIAGKEEVALLLAFVEVGRKDVLKHPVCETFLYLKWLRIRKFVLLSLIYHIVFVMMYSVYITGIYIKNCPSLRFGAIECDTSMYITIIGYVLIFLNSVLVAKEIFQLFHDFKGYVKQLENWLQVAFIISVYFCTSPGSEHNVQLDIHNWQHHLAAISIFLAWLDLMIIVGRFPVFGLYFQMFKTVALNFSKFIMAYSCLLVAFNLSFGVLFANYPSFSNIPIGLLKIFIMMSGELEYEDLFFTENQELLYPITTHILFLVFVILVTIILANLMVGLAVSDIQGLQESACLDRLVRQVELVARLESMLFSPLLGCLPPRVLMMFRKMASLIVSRYRWAVCIRPNDPRESRLPKDLLTSIYNLVASRKDKSKSTKTNQNYANLVQNGCSVKNVVKNENGIRKTFSIIRPRTKSDIGHSNISLGVNPPDNDTLMLMNKLNELTLKVDRIQKALENKLELP